jgi:TPR repeat protein
MDGEGNGSMRTRRCGTEVLVAFLLMGGATISAASPGSTSYAEALDQARRAWKQGELKAAGRALKAGYKLARAADDREGARRALRGLARVYQRLKRPAQVRKVLEMAAQLAPVEGVGHVAAGGVEGALESAPPQTTEEALEVLASGDPDWVPVALEALERRGGIGDVHAARVLGALHIEGQLLEPDLARGLAWIDLAIAGGDRDSMIYKAELLERGLGVPLDLVAARDLYRQAAEAGSLVAAHRLGKALSARGETREAERWLAQAAEAGHTAAQVDLGVMFYRLGGRDEEAADWFHRAASGGDAEARYNLGLCLLHGRGLVADRDLAVNYFRQAASSGSFAAVRALVALNESMVDPASSPETD